MKKKTIEKIPYLGLQKISRKKSAKYIGVTAIKIIGHKKHLLLEVYENKKESKKIPVVRITLTKKDFGTYWPDKNIWTRQQVSYYRPIWMETYTGGILTDENILQSPEDLERIKNFCGTKLFDASWWWEHISRYEADITSTERILLYIRARLMKLTRRQKFLRKLKAPAGMNSWQQERKASRPQISSQSGITNMTGSRSAYTTASASPYTVHTDRETMTG